MRPGGIRTVAVADPPARTVTGLGNKRAAPSVSRSADAALTTIFVVSALKNTHQWTRFELLRDSRDVLQSSVGFAEGAQEAAGADLELRVPEGTVVTVEPGVYVAGLGGVRIEDMVAVGAEGCRVLPRTTKELVVL